MQQFHGSDEYIASDELIRSVNIAAALKKPLLIKGEPGTGKTMLAEAIARSLDMELLIWNIKSTTRAQDGLYVYDTVQRLYDSIFHYIAFPEQPMMEKIIKAHYPDLDQKLIDGVLDAFYRVRDLRGLQKKPSTSEVLDWIQALVIGGVPVEKLEKEIPFAGVLLKKTEDLKLVENNRYVY